jgi:hypothetical protein
VVRAENELAGFLSVQHSLPSIERLNLKTVSMWKNRPIEVSNHTLLTLLTYAGSISYCLPTKKVQDGLVLSANSCVF